ncbi:DUF1330 domain-containing protein [Pseudonocardia sichuanensis]
MSGYVILNGEVTDPDAYEEYKAGAQQVVAEHGGRFLARGGAATVVEGEWLPRVVVVEFPSYDAALAFYRSPEYQRLVEIREACSTASVVIVEGAPAPRS